MYMDGTVKSTVVTPKVNTSYFTGVCPLCKKVLESVQFTSKLMCPNCNKEVKT